MSKKFIRILLSITVVLSSLAIVTHFSYYRNLPHSSLDYGRSFYANYLSGIYLVKKRELSAASNYFYKSLKTSHQLDQAAKEQIFEDIFLANILSGKVEEAANFAKEDNAIEGKSDLKLILQAFAAIKAKNYNKALSHLEKAKNISNRYFDSRVLSLVISWCKAAAGDFDQALKIAEQVAKEYEGHSDILEIQQALLSEFNGKLDKAKEYYLNAVQYSTSDLTIKIATNFFVRQNDHGQLEKIRSLAQEQNYFKDNSTNQNIDNKANEIVIKDIEDGMLFTLSAISALLLSGKFYVQSLIYSQFALYLEPNYVQANIIVGNYYTENNQYEKANKYYDLVPQNNASYQQAQIEIANNLTRLKRFKEAQQLLEASYNKFHNIDAAISLILLLGEQEKYQDAIKLSSEIIKISEQEKKPNWYYYYLRGSNYSMIKDYQKFEQDFQKALELSPEQYHIMNDLGYTWLEQGKKQEQAMKLIKAAYEQDPDNPYIMDSLAWGLYLEKKYQEGVVYLERAAELMPEDVVVHEHLGDFYWKLGYKTAAIFEWQYAIENSKNGADTSKLEHKIAEGLN